MTLAPFPDLVPDYIRTVQLGDFNVKRTNMGFSEVSVRMADRAKVELSLEFVDRGSSDFQVFLTFYHSARGAWRKFSLPQSVWRHGNAYQSALADLAKTQYWRFAEEPPTITTVKRGFYSFNIKLVSVFSPPPIPPALTFPCNL